MDEKTIIRLLDAGFSKDEIMEIKGTAAVASGTESSLNGTPGSNSDGARPGSQVPDEEGTEPENGAVQSEDPNEGLKAWLKDMQASIAKDLKELKEMQQQYNVKTFNVGDDHRKMKTARETFTEIYQPAVYNVEEEN